MVAREVLQWFSLLRMWRHTERCQILPWLFLLTAWENLPWWFPWPENDSVTTGPAHHPQGFKPLATDHLDICSQLSLSLLSLLDILREVISIWHTFYSHVNFSLGLFRKGRPQQRSHPSSHPSSGASLPLAFLRMISDGCDLEFCLQTKAFSLT